MVVECAGSGFCGAVLGTDKTTAGWAVILEDRHGSTRLFPLRPAGFLLEGQPVTLVMARTQPTGPRRSASGSRYVEGVRAAVARGSRIWVEGIHDAELLEHVWGHDLRVAAVVVEPLHGADHLLAAVTEFRPGPAQRLGVLLDHMIPGSKEHRLADEVRARFPDDVLVVGHPFVDVWQAVKPRALGIEAWPSIPPGQPWKSQVIRHLRWKLDEGEAWQHILGHVRGYGDLEPEILGPVEQLIDFVTETP